MDRVGALEMHGQLVAAAGADPMALVDFAAQDHARGREHAQARLALGLGLAIAFLLGRRRRLGGLLVAEDHVAIRFDLAGDAAAARGARVGVELLEHVGAQSSAGEVVLRLAGRGGRATHRDQRAAAFDPAPQLGGAIRHPARHVAVRHDEHVVAAQVERAEALRVGQRRRQAQLEVQRVPHVAEGVVVHRRVGEQGHARPRQQFEVATAEVRAVVGAARAGRGLRERARAARRLGHAPAGVGTVLVAAHQEAPARERAAGGAERLVAQVHLQPELHRLRREAHGAVVLAVDDPAVHGSRRVRRRRDSRLGSRQRGDQRSIDLQVLAPRSVEVPAERRRPRRHVVGPRNALGLELLPLARQRGLVVLRIEVEQRLDVRRQRLARRHDQRARGVLARRRLRARARGSLGLERRRGLADLDALAREQVDEAPFAVGVASGDEHVHAVVAGRGGIERGALGGEVLAQRRLAVCRQRRDVGDRAQRLAMDAVAVGDDFPRQAAHRVADQARLLVQDPAGALEGRPRVRVAGIPRVGPLARVVAPAQRVELAREVGGVRVPPLPRVGGEGGRERIVGRIDEEGVHRAHLVRVDHQLGHPGADGGPARAGLGLRAERPVAVHVVQVVVAAPVGPAAAVHAVAVDVRRVARVLHQHRQDALASIGVHARVEHDHDLVEHVEHVLGRAGRVVVRHGEAGVRSRHLVAVDRVRQPRDGRRLRHQPLALGLRQAARIRQALDGRADRGQPGAVRLRRDDGDDQLAALVRAADGLDRQPLRRRLDAPQRGHHLVVVRREGARRPPEQLLDRGHGRVVGRAGEERGRRLLPPARPVAEVDRARRLDRRPWRGDLGGGAGAGRDEQEGGVQVERGEFHVGHAEGRILAFPDAGLRWNSAASGVVSFRLQHHDAVI
ncbi:MAG: hypothetical protein RL112_2001 [Planctomycetota bacterium]